MTDSSVVPIKLAVVALLVTSASTAAATSVLVRDPNPVVPVTGAIHGANDLTVDAQHLSYDGINVTGVTVTVNNTGSTDHTGVVHLALKNGSTTVASATTSEVTFAANGTTDVTVSLTADYSLAEIDRVEVTVERTD